MRKGPVEIPYDTYDRTVEHFKGTPKLESVKSKVHAAITLRNLLSHIYRAHHFDSVEEFLDNMSRLTNNVSRVTILQSEVMEKKYENNTLELTISDGAGKHEAKLVYPYELEEWEDSPDTTKNPLHGAETGDKIRIFDSYYLGMNRIQSLELYVLNNNHYSRMKVHRK